MDDMQVSQATATDDYVSPRNAIEAAVAEIWAELLEVERVGRDGNFLLLGGESLLAAQAAAHIEQRFHCEVSLRSILVGTVADVADEIVAHCRAGRA